eukprot:4496682-Pleurochrysis_carterae.AAC.1
MARPTVQVTRCHARRCATMRSVPTAARTTQPANIASISWPVDSAICTLTSNWRSTVARW